jgi:hypothetical protein
MAKPKPKQDDKTQAKRFIEKAREIEADESDKPFERAFKKIAPPKRPQQTARE